jgi:hypothetical protein
MRRRLERSLGLVLLALPLSIGCATPPTLYDWGIYESLLWEGYRADHGDADPATQLARLEEDVQRIVTSGARVPPGVHAHIGFLRYATGDPVAGREHFLEERELFPESAVFIDGVLARMKAREEMPAAPAVLAEPEAPETADGSSDAPLSSAQEPAPVDEANVERPVGKNTAEEDGDQ